MFCCALFVKHVALFSVHCISLNALISLCCPVYVMLVSFRSCVTHGKRQLNRRTLCETFNSFCPLNSAVSFTRASCACAFHPVSCVLFVARFVMICKCYALRNAIYVLRFAFRTTRI